MRRATAAAAAAVASGRWVERCCRWHGMSNVDGAMLLLAVGGTNIYWAMLLQATSVNVDDTSCILHKDFPGTITIYSSTLLGTLPVQPQPFPGMLGIVE